MNEVVILIPIVNMPQNRTEEQLVLFMSSAVEKLIELGALKGTVDDIIKDYFYDEATNYINVTVPSEVIGLTNELEAVGAATCPTYKVATDMLQYIDAADGELKTFSAATINERLRIAMRNPKLRFRYTVMDYKRYYKQKESKLKKDKEMATKLKNMFLTDVMGMFTEVLPLIEEGKQLATLVGTSQITPKLNKSARELSLAYRRALRMEKSSNQLNKSIYTKLKKAYTEFMNLLIEQVFPGLMEDQKEESRKYARCVDGRINLFSEPTDAELEHEAEEEVLNEETRALNEDLKRFEEESQSEYSGPELGENTYIVAKYVTKKSDIYYIELVSELNSDYPKLDQLKKGQSFIKDEWTITKLSDTLELDEALKLLKKQGVKTFSDGMQEVTFRTTNPEQLTKIVNAIGKCGNGGHSFEIVIDPDSTKEEGGNIKFGWDGDGSDRVEVTEDKTFSEVDDTWIDCDWPEGEYPVSYDDFYINYNDGEGAMRYETEEYGDEEFKGTLIVKNGKCKLFKSKTFSDSSVIRKEAKRLFKIFNPKATDAEIEKLINFGLDLAADPQDLINSLKDNIKKQGKTFSDKDKDWYVVGILVNEDGEEEVYSAVQPQEEKPTKEDVLKFETKAQDLKYFKVFANEESADAYRDGLSAKMPKRYSKSITFSEPREKVSAEMLEKAKTDGVVQKKPNGSWGIVSIDAGEWWTPDYESKEKAENALAAYHANKFNK